MDRIRRSRSPTENSSKNGLHDRSGMSSLMLLILVGSAVGILAASMVTLQIQSAREGNKLRTERLNRSNYSALSQYIELAVRNRWCLNPDLTRSLGCEISHERATERLLMSLKTWEALQQAGRIPSTTAYPGDYGSLEGTIPESGCSSAEGLSEVAAHHPLSPLLATLREDFRCIQWRLKKACSASTSGTSCTTKHPAPMGNELFVGLWIKLVPKETGPGVSSPEEEATLAVVPRMVNSYAAIFKGDISANFAFSGGTSLPTSTVGPDSYIRSRDSIIRFPYENENNAQVIFQGPVLTNGDLIIPPPGSTPTANTVRVTFNDIVNLSGGKILTHPCPSEFANSPHCVTAVNQKKKGPLASSEPGRLLSQADGFGGLMRGALQDATADPGLHCLLADSYKGADHSFGVDQFPPNSCLQSSDRRRVSAILVAQNMGDPEVTEKSSMVIRRLTPSSSNSWAGPVAGTDLHSTSTFVVGLTNRNWFEPQVNWANPTASQSTESYASEVLEADAITPVEKTFPANPAEIWLNSPPQGAPATTNWATFSDPLDPRKTATRGKPIVLVTLAKVQKQGSDTRIKRLAELPMGVNSEFKVALKTWNPAEHRIDDSPFRQSPDGEDGGNCGTSETTEGCISRLRKVNACENLEPADNATLKDRLEKLSCYWRAIKNLHDGLMTARDNLSSVLSARTNALNACNTSLTAHKACCNNPSNTGACNDDHRDDLGDVGSCQDQNDLNDLEAADFPGVTSACYSSGNALSTAIQAFDVASSAVSSQVGSLSAPFHALRNYVRPDTSACNNQNVCPIENPSPSQTNTCISCVDQLIPQVLGTSPPNDSAKVLGKLRNQIKNFYDLGMSHPVEAQRSWVNESISGAVPGIDPNLLAPAAELNFSPPTPAGLPEMIISTAPIAHRHPIAGHSPNPENPRYTWRSDQFRMAVQFKNTHYSNYDPSALQIELKAFDAASDPAGDGRARPVSTWGPNCSWSRYGSGNSEETTDFCLFDTESEGFKNQNKMIFSRSPNVLRLEMPTSNLNGTLQRWTGEGPNLSIDLSAANLPLRRFANLGDVTHSTVDPRFRLLQSCDKAKLDQGTLDTVAIRAGEWFSMNCPQESALNPANLYPSSVEGSSPKFMQYNVAPSWAFDTSAGNNGTMVGNPMFKGHTPGDTWNVAASSVEAFDPLEISFYDQPLLGGSSGALATAESFAAATARTSWDFNRPKEFNPWALAEETASYAVFGATPESASQFLLTNSLPTTAYTLSSTGVPELQDNVKIWAALGTQKTVQPYSLLERCVVLSNVSLLVGFLGCDRLEIQQRTNPLTLIGTFIIGQLDLPKVLKANIHFYNIDHPLAQRRLRAEQFLMTSPATGDPASCPLVYGSGSIPPLFQFGAGAASQQYRSCEIADLRSTAEPFNWSVVDPECGFASNNEWVCDAPGWFRRFRILRLSINRKNFGN